MASRVQRYRLWKCAAVGASILAMTGSTMPMEGGDKTQLRCGENLYLVVGKVEPFAHVKTAVHVQAFSGGQLLVTHMPFDEEALRDCVPITPVEALEFDQEAFDCGYDIWHEDKGGIFTVTPSEAVKLIFETSKDD